MNQPKRLLVLLAHGSRDPKWQEPFQLIKQQIQASQSLPVILAYMELCEPSLATIAEQINPEQTCQIDVLPLFFAAGRHLRQDVPQQIEQLEQQYPQLTIKLHPPVGVHHKLVQALVEVALDLDAN
ncbi:hypothetical protein BTE48_03250 [Oceanospirillum multiglobuliferum]|uniref:Cobalamin biosynthesis protein CbiX n=1 Tax=Oceanospirillum multiglobuliferum TaxID=64969 RepID=A0A1V4T9K7_9GAMM|nr:hypothetical protein BTE48_03250 [Oceanospirillum multiglobuliferum]